MLVYLCKMFCMVILRFFMHTILPESAPKSGRKSYDRVLYCIVLYCIVLYCILCKLYYVIFYSNLYIGRIHLAIMCFLFLLYTCTTMYCIYMWMYDFVMCRWGLEYNILLFWLRTCGSEIKPIIVYYYYYSYCRLMSWPLTCWHMGCCCFICPWCSFCQFASVVSADRDQYCTMSLF